ncbi:MAG: nuclear transport factor 2 family protein [Chloroflexota bacterium]
MTDPEFAAAITAAFQAFNERRFADFATYVTDDVVEIYPQSGERFEGRARQQAFHEAFANPPTFTVRNVLRSGDLAVAEVDEHYPDGSVWKDVWILLLREGAVASMTGYFGEPFPAPEWRRPYRVQPSGQ